MRFLGFGQPKVDDQLVVETRLLRVGMDKVAGELREIAESLKVANDRLEASNIPLEDMARGRAPRRRRANGRAE